jgi:RHS repeat-associated protein
MNNNRLNEKVMCYIKQIITVIGALGTCVAIHAQPVSRENNIPASNAPPPQAQQFPGLANYGNTGPRNFIRTFTPKIPVQDASALSLPSSLFFLEGGIATQYFDGLGRPLQEIAYRGSGTANKDITTVHVYDNAGRETVAFPPFSTPINTDPGKLKTQALTDISNQYSALYPGELAYSKTRFDNSPLNRIEEIQAPGNNWIGANRGRKVNYETNTTSDAVLKWSVNASTGLPVAANAYPTGDLDKTVFIDEDGKISCAYKNTIGQVVCKRNALVNAPTSPFTPAEWTQTYYLYNDLNQLVFVLSPLAVKDNRGTISQEVCDELCYSYRYDTKGRLAEKMLPGKKAEYIVYDDRDRIVFTQDGNLRGAGKWLAIIYDGLNRAIATAIYPTSQSRSQLAALMSNAGITQANYNSSQLLYHLKSRNTVRNPFTFSAQLTDAELIQRNYYDDYNYNGFASMQYSTAHQARFQQSLSSPLPVQSLNVRGQLTYSATRVQQADGTWDGWIAAACFYDDKGRVIQQMRTNLKEGTDITSLQYDFTGMITAKVEAVNNPASTTGTTTITTRYNKDPYNSRLTSVLQRINEGRWMVLGSNTYDDLGRLIQQKMASDNAGGFTNNYTYNIRNWLTGINPDFVDNNATSVGPSGPFFGEKICYDKGFGSRLYNGNIAGIVWKGGPYTGLNRQCYGYTYDNLDRLIHAEHGTWNMVTGVWERYNAAAPEKVNFTVANLSYDYNGNLLSMTQNGPIKDPRNSRPQIFGNMDVLSYYYKPYSNKLESVMDNVSTVDNLAATPDYRDSRTGTVNYGYDNNGNLLSDANKGITGISYSVSDKPLTINILGNKIGYTYDALGNKLQKKTTAGAAAPEVWDYLGSCVFKNNQLQYILHEEGRARPVANNPEFDYDYFIKDHLGNVRTVVSTASIPYYPPIDISSDNGSVGVGMLSGTQGPGTYTATMEVASANIENLVWDHLNEVRAAKPASRTPDDEKAALLDGRDPAKRIGTAILLRVMPGDRFTLSGDGYYEGSEMSEPAVSGDKLAQSLLTSLAGGTAGGIPVAELEENRAVLQQAIGAEHFAAMTDLLHCQNTDPGRPASHLNYMVLDESFMVQKDQSGARQIMGDHSWTTVSVDGDIHINQAGYLLVFTSNSANRVVFWDRIALVQYTGSIVEENHYYPFGLTLSSSAAGMMENKYKYQGIELEKSFGLEAYETFYRGLDPQIGRFNGVDPKSEFGYSVSPFASMVNNPVKNVDPLGDVASTHTDNDGNVIAVYNDGDLGVYKHGDNANGKVPTRAQIDKRHEKSNSAGGEKIGATEYWDEFADLKTKEPVGSLVLDNRTEASWDYIVKWMHNDAMNYDLPEIANKSKLHQKYDLKNDADWAGVGPNHEMKGRLLNGKWATARSAGNFLAGWNGATATYFFGRVTGTNYMKMAGALNVGEWNKANAAGILIYGTSYGPPPYYGEDEYSGRRIAEGLKFGNAKK